MSQNSRRCLRTQPRVPRNLPRTMGEKKGEELFAGEEKVPREQWNERLDFPSSGVLALPLESLAMGGSLSPG